jgi:hypothetical protein
MESLTIEVALVSNFPEQEDELIVREDLHKHSSDFGCSLSVGRFCAATADTFAAGTDDDFPTVSEWRTELSEKTFFEWEPACKWSLRGDEVSDGDTGASCSTFVIFLYIISDFSIVGFHS